MARTWVLLRGLVREQRHWDDFTALFQGAVPADQVVTLDLPGNGSRHGQTSSTRIPAMVADLRAQLRQRGLPGPYHVVALSLGGMLAVQWLSQAPQEVAFASLINTSVSRFSPFWRRLRPVNYPRLLKDGLFSKRPWHKERMILDLTTNLLTPQQCYALAEKWADYAHDSPVSTANSLRQLLAAMRFSAPLALPRQVPVQVVNGGADRLVSPRCSQALASAWGLPLRVHHQAGHDLPLDAPQWLVNTLLEGVTNSAIS